MQGTIHVFDILTATDQRLPDGICPLFGGDRFLQQLALRAISTQEDSETSSLAIRKFEGNHCQWAEVLDELSTRSLFDRAATRIAVVDEADPFVKKHRERLEAFQQQPYQDAVLVLMVNNWASNTRLYKQIEKSGLQVHCDAPRIKRGRSKQRDEARIIAWLVKRAEQQYEFELPPAGAMVLTELCEDNFGRMDQELAKISLYASTETSFTPQQIRQIVGGWPAQTMWTAIDSALDGQAGHALDMLHQLFAAGEHPLAMFGQIAWALRRYAEAGEILKREQRGGNRANLTAALKEAGFRNWGREIENASQRINRLGRQRVSKILDWVVEADLALKRSHAKEDRGRLVLELLFLRLSEELDSSANPA